ncbi:MAG: RsmD family RNA methyltransferase [Methanoregula sp.]|nr:RsmD family RNA methyltransferase [Methanoregula sp.]
MALHTYIPAIMGLKAQLRGIIPDQALCSISDHFDVIGDIAVISIPQELSDYKQHIAQEIISRRRNIYTVLNKVAKVSGEERTAKYEILAGDTTVTLHHEFGFAYRLDVSRVFFNTRLSCERMRVIDQTECGERVLVPFCGVGPFAIPAAAKRAQVVAVEQNPDAYFWLEENVSLNKVRKNIITIHGDAFDTGLLPHRQFDRVIIPAPYGMDGILDILSPLAVRGGMIHFYTFKTRNEIPALIEEYAQKGFDLTYYNSCGNVAPGVSRWVFDLVYSPRP